MWLFPDFLRFGCNFLSFQSFINPLLVYFTPVSLLDICTCHGTSEVVKQWLIQIQSFQGSCEPKECTAKFAPCQPQPRWKMSFDLQYSSNVQLWCRIWGQMWQEVPQKWEYIQNLAFCRNLSYTNNIAMFLTSNLHAFCLNMSWDTNHSGWDVFDLPQSLLTDCSIVTTMSAETSFTTVSVFTKQNSCLI